MLSILPIKIFNFNTRIYAQETKNAHIELKWSQKATISIYKLFNYFYYARFGCFESARIWRFSFG